MLSECSDAFPPLVLFTSRRGGKERKKKNLFFPGIGGKLFVFQPSTILPLQERRGGKTGYVCISNQVELGIIFCE